MDDDPISPIESSSSAPAAPADIPALATPEISPHDEQPMPDVDGMSADRVDVDPGRADSEAEGPGHADVEAMSARQAPGLSAQRDTSPTSHEDPQLANISAALNGGAFAYQNQAGQANWVDVARQASTEDGRNVYELKVHGWAEDSTLRVEVGRNQDPTQVLDRTLNYYTQVPEHLRGDLKELAVHDGASPNDEYWRGQPGYTPDHMSAAEGGNGRIDFYGGMNNLNQGTFDHEFAHVMGGRRGHVGEDPAARTSRFNMTPRGWQEAAERDGRHPSDYAHQTQAAGTGNWDEDFADTWASYLDARRNGTMDQFRAVYPARSAALDPLYHPPPF